MTAAEIKERFLTLLSQTDLSDDKRIQKAAQLETVVAERLAAENERKRLTSEFYALSPEQQALVRRLGHDPTKLSPEEEFWDAISPRLLDGSLSVEDVQRLLDDDLPLT